MELVVALLVKVAFQKRLGNSFAICNANYLRVKVHDIVTLMLSSRARAL